MSADFDFSKQEVIAKDDARICYNFVGGEDAALRRLDEYLFKTKSVQHYNDTRNQFIGANYSSKLSPWLANGSLSIRTVYHKTKEFE